VVKTQRTLIGFGIALICAGSLGLFNAPKVVKADAIGFGTPTVMDPVHTFGEPNLGINPVDGSMYDSGPQGTGVQRSGWEASVDGGASFREVNQCPNTDQNTVLLPCGPNAAQDQSSTTSTPGGGDAEQKFDAAGNQYFADLYALACQRVAYTPDDGSHAFETPFGCGQTQPACGGTTNHITSPTVCPGEGSDRQWLAVLDPGFRHTTSIPHPVNAPDGSHYTGPFPLVYMEYNNLGTVQNNCSDWFMIGNPGNPTTNLQYAPANNTANGNFGCDGYPSVNQDTGQVLEASTGGGCGTGNQICLNIGTPDSTGFLHFRDDPGGPGLIKVADHLANDGADLFVVSSIDSADNLHVSWGEDPSSSTAASNGWQMFTTVASAASGYMNWATPVQVSSAPANVNIFPWVAAGDGPECQTSLAARIACAGRSDTSWYGTSDNTEGPSSTSPGNQVWDVYMAQVVWPVDPSTGAYTGGAPRSVQQVKVTPHPMQYGAICLLGTGCITAQGNRNVADFFEVAVDSHGAALVVYDDNSNNLLQPGAPASVQAADHAGAGVITVARQTSGLGLTGTDVPAACSVNCIWSLGTPNYETSAPVSGMTDALNDALNNPAAGKSGTEVNALDLTGNQLSLSNNGSTLTVTMRVKSLSTTDLTTAFSAGPFLSYVTRWLMPSASGAGVCSLPTSTACTMFYAIAEVTPASVGGGVVVSYAAGRAQSVDLCSVSACFPHDVYYPEGPPAGNVITCTTCFDQSTGTITIPVPTSDVGSPTQTSLLEEVGTYAMAGAHPQQAIQDNNALAQADTVPFEVDGLCCFNFEAAAPELNVPETPWAPAFLGIGAALVVGGIALRRRRSMRTATTDSFNGR
jgi:hypothetical protein